MAGISRIPPNPETQERVVACNVSEMSDMPDQRRHNLSHSLHKMAFRRRKSYWRRRESGPKQRARVEKGVPSGFISIQFAVLVSRIFVSAFSWRRWKCRQTESTFLHQGSELISIREGPRLDKEIAKKSDSRILQQNFSSTLAAMMMNLRHSDVIRWFVHFLLWKTFILLFSAQNSSFHSVSLGTF